MERSEPALIPEWLKSNGTIGGGNGLNHHSSSSLSHSDDRGNRYRTRSKYSFSNGGYDTPRSVISDPSHFSRKPVSNGSTMHEKNHQLRSCNSFGRSRDKDWGADIFDGCDKDRWFQNDRRDRHSTPFGVSSNSVNNGMDRTLRRSRSMISGKQDDSWLRRRPSDSNTHQTNGASNAEGMDGSVKKSAFEKDFPSIAEERPGTPDIIRAPSPSLSTPVQSFPVSVSHVKGGEGWNSALAEMHVAAGSNNTLTSSGQQHAPNDVPTVAVPAINGLSMAETLAQVPSRAHSTPQISVESQRLEVLAIKQSRQLIPVISSLPKTSVSKSEKLKPKAASRSEINPSSKVGYQQLSSLRPVSNSVLSVPAKSDMAPGHGTKFSILRLPQERNGVSNDKENPPNSASTPITPPAVVTPVRPANNYAPPMEKRPTMSQAQSRNDFFNLMRNKSSTNLSSTTSVDPKCSSLSTILESTGTADVISQVHNESSDETNSRMTHVTPFEVVHLEDEEERSFLCSLGWDENAGDCEGLTEEEITAFNAVYKEYMQMKPPLKINGTYWQPKCAPPMTSHLDVSDGDDETSSSDSDADA
ncbi:hypothetical protein ACHQM5_022679 [Ranunculus cassubicifolius]